MRKLTTKEYIDKFISVHGNKYDYSLVEYKGNKHKVIILDPVYGPFKQAPVNHLKGFSGSIRSAINKTEWYINQAKEVHSDYYGYDKVDYIDSQNKVILNCTCHGDFRQLPDKHLKGQGCPECKKLKLSKFMQSNPVGWSYSNWEKKGLKSKHFDSFKVYIIRCWNDEEEFYKIGKTFNTIVKRFERPAQMPYKYEVVQIIEGDAEFVSILEHKMQNRRKENKYLPKIEFNGMYECYSIVNL